MKIDGEHTYEWVPQEFKKFILEFKPERPEGSDDLDGDDETEIRMMHSSHGEGQ